MGYSEALTAAGCKVLDYKTFGDYQGTWLAFVELNGEKGIVQGSFGSCSGCDAFEAEFGYNDTPEQRDGKYYKDGYCDEEVTKEEFDELKAVYDKRIRDFGASYLSGGLYNKQHYEDKLLKKGDDDWFDEEEKEYAQWAVNQNWEVSV